MPVFVFVCLPSPSRVSERRAARSNPGSPLFFLNSRFMFSAVMSCTALPAVSCRSVLFSLAYPVPAATRTGLSWFFRFAFPFCFWSSAGTRVPVAPFLVVVSLLDLLLVVFVSAYPSCAFLSSFFSLLVACRLPPAACCLLLATLASSVRL